MMNEKELLLKLIASLTLADNLSDVAEDTGYALKLLGPPWSDLEWWDLSELGTALGERGITTLYGTSLVEDPNE